MTRLIATTLFSIFNLILNAQVWLEETVIDTQVVASQLEIPWQMDWLGDNELIFTERTGAIKKLDLNSGEVHQVGTATPSLALEQQAGLMGLQVDPGFPSTPYVYCAQASYYGANIAIDVNQYSYDLVNDTLVFDSTIIKQLPGSNTNTGGRLLISSDNYLYLTLGDAKNNEAAQDVNSPNGKIHRFHLDGSIPNDNPFAGSSVFTFGHRNPQGLAEDPNGNIWISEHGPSSSDELNKLEAGGNYGWPLVLGACNTSNQTICDSLNIIEPLISFSPTIAPAGICFFNETSVPEWNNTILMTSLKEQRLMVEKMNESLTSVNYTSWVFQYQLGRLRDVFLSPTGRLFVCTSNKDALGEPTMNDDKIIELVPSPHNSVKEVRPNASSTFQVRHNRLEFNTSFSGKVEVFNLLGQCLWEEDVYHITSVTLPHFGSSQPLILSTSNQNKTNHSQLIYLN